MYTPPPHVCLTKVSNLDCLYSHRLHCLGAYILWVHLVRECILVPLRAKFVHANDFLSASCQGSQKNRRSKYLSNAICRALTCQCLDLSLKGIPFFQLSLRSVCTHNRAECFCVWKNFCDSAQATFLTFTELAAGGLVWNNEHSTGSKSAFDRQIVRFWLRKRAESDWALWNVWVELFKAVKEARWVMIGRTGKMMFLHCRMPPTIRLQRRRKGSCWLLRRKTMMPQNLLERMKTKKSQNGWRAHPSLNRLLPVL